MRQRLAWLGLAISVALFALFFALWGVKNTLAEPTNLSADPFAVIINEWSQGTGGSKEWVELVIASGPLDLRGWDLGDLSPGDLTFTEHALWQSVPIGTRLVIYNASDPDSILPADDTDPADCRLVLPHNGPYFSGSWPAFANSSTDDNPHLRDDGDSSIHNFSVAPGSALHPGSQENVMYLGGSANGVTQSVNWVNGPAAGATPGTGNGGANTAWLTTLCGQSTEDKADLVVSKSGPATAVPGATLNYEIQVKNNGTQPANEVVITDILPAQLTYVPGSGPFNQVAPQTLEWTVATLAPGEEKNLTLAAVLAADAAGIVSNNVQGVTTSAESALNNNSDSVETAVNSTAQPLILIDAVLYDGIATNDMDEAVALRNLSNTPADVSGWALTDGGSKALVPAGSIIPANAVYWVARDAAAFSRQFGFAPDSAPANWPGYSNAGDEVVLLDAAEELVDALVYGSGNTAQPGWQGGAVDPYTVSSVFGKEGQIIYRKRFQLTGLPVPDTDQAADWAQHRDDLVNGRKVLYPGWDLDSFFFTQQITETAVLTVGIAPDNAYETVAAQINSAQTSLQIESLTFENLALANDFISAAERGVAVTVLLEGGPSGGLPDQEKYICQELEAAGGACWFMISDEDSQIRARYRFLHAKFILVDGERAVISSENLSPNSMPSDDKQDGTWGRRGMVLVTDAPGVVAHLQNMFAKDFDPTNHVDIFRWQSDHPDYGQPPAGFIPQPESGGITYTVRYPQATTFTGNFAFEIVQSPESSLRDTDALLGLVNQAGAGDAVFVQQLNERPYWGASSSNPSEDPNLRLEAYMAAARRGATVKVMLDAYFDNPASVTSNSAACDYVNNTAHNEHLNLTCTLGNPAGLGIHNKMVLANINGRGYIHIGSINGTEQSSKGNRELALQVQSDAAYALLADMFVRDQPQQLFLPVVLNQVQGPANNVLISEVLYDPFGLDDAEFVELVNPTAGSIDISGFGLGDALNPDDFEDVRRFPPGTILDSKHTLVVATTAAAFFDGYGLFPDFEIIDTETAVPELIDDPNWGDSAALFQLGNQGDEVILRDSIDNLVDALAYGSGNIPGQTSCQLLSAAGHSLERAPYWLDTNQCPQDFRDWPFPNPGQLAQ